MPAEHEVLLPRRLSPPPPPFENFPLLDPREM